MKFVKLLGIFKKNQSNSNEVNDGTLSYEIWITFDPNEDGWGSFHVFDLTLKSSIDIEKEGIVKYLKHAKINCLNYVGIQI